jgi:arylsulfatase A-like enzyme
MQFRVSLYGVGIAICIMCSTTSTIAKSPNIVLVITDDQGYGPLGRHGNRWIETPNLDKLHDTSTRMTRFLVSPTCSPTRSALMTGRHPLKNGVTHTISERERMTLDAVILPQVLKTASYTSGIFGKWHLGDEEEYQPNHRGFEEAFIHGAGGIGQAYSCSCADVPNNSYFDPIIRHNGRFVKTSGFCTDVFFDAALTWIDQRRHSDQPFFAYISTNAPHSPYHAPPQNVARFERMGFDKDTAGFYGMVENIDANVGRLMQQLDAWQMLEETIVIFMSDNGMAGGGGVKGKQPVGRDENGRPLEGWNANMKGLKGSPDEGGVRVPFFIRWDGHFAANRDIDVVAAHLDILPTLAAIAGAQLPANQVEGRNLLPLLSGAAAPADWADRYLFTHVGRWPLGQDPDQSQWKGFAVRNQKYRMVGNELFDMEADPSQKVDVAEQHPNVVTEMRAAFDQFWKESRPLMVNEMATQSATRPYWTAYQRQVASEGIPNWHASFTR